MIEKMARAMVVERYGTDEASYALLNGDELPEWPRFVPLARAALQAIREPDTEAVSAGDGALAHDVSAKQCFRAMIDAILNEQS